MEKFYRYLKDKKKDFLKKSEIEDYFKEFKEIWKFNNNFDKVFDSLRKKITYIFDDYWSLLDDEFIIVMQKFLDFLNIENYYGLESALYFNKNIWQAPKTYYLLNTKYNRKRKAKGIVVEFLKIPKMIFNKETLIKDKIIFSNYEKTILDLLFFERQKKYELGDISRIKLYIGLYPEDFIRKFKELK
jgi:hypothetical protein